MLTLTYEKFLIFLCILFSLSSHAQQNQQNILDSFSARFITAIRSHEKPQAYLSIDKSIFKSGESVWFTAFLLNAISEKITTKTKYLIVDVVNEKDSIISLVLLDASSQQLSNKIILPRDIAPGYYWIRAYTKQIAEADSNYCSIKSLYVMSPSGRHISKLSSSKISLNNTDKPVMIFYPEGGSVITGANSDMAFFIKDETGNPIQTDGVIKDNRDTIVTDFASNKSGLGKFNFLPSSHRKYKACFNWKGKEVSYALPAYNFYAGQIAVTKPLDGNIALRILLEDSIYKSDLITYIIGISKDSLCFAGIGRGQYELTVPEQKFPDGIATFYLFDNNLKFLSERSVYVKEHQIITRTLTDKAIYGKRDKVALSVSITDAAKKPVPSLLSVSVTDSIFAATADCTVPVLNNAAFINNIILTNSECFTREDIDLLMLTRNNTYLSFSNNIIKTLPVNDDSLLYINGTAFDDKNQSAANKILTLLSYAANTSFTIDTTDDAGKFSFPVSGYFDSTQFAIEAKDQNHKNIKVKIITDAPLFPHFKTPASLKQYFSAEPLLANRYRNAYLDTSFTATAKSLPIVYIKKDEGYTESKRISNYSAIIGPDKLDERTTLGNTILNIGGLHLLNGFLVINGLTSIKSPDASSEPLLLIDGAEAPNAGSLNESRVMGTLNSINPKDVDFIEILKGPDGAAYGERGGNGVILVNLLSSRRENIFNNSSNMKTFYFKGISKPALFPGINYDQRETMSSENFDNRSVIFWDGSVLTGTDDQVNLSFFTSDIPTTYKVTITGITVHGNFIYKVLYFKSK